MTILHKLAVGFLAVGLAACEHTAPPNVPRTVDPGPAPVKSSSTATSSAARVAPQQQSSAVITLHLAQQQPEPTLIEVDAGGDKPVYALPRPVLTQLDIGRVAPLNTPDGTFILLEMNERGIPKLDNITRQASGHFLLLSVQGQLVSVAQIGDTIKDGRLLVSTQNQQHSRAIISMMRSGS